MSKKDEIRMFLELSECEDDKAMLIIKRGKSPDIAIWLNLEEVERLKTLLVAFKYKLKNRQTKK